MYISPTYEDLKDSYVAFIDILGFNQRIKNISDRGSFNNVLNVLCYTKMKEMTLNKEIGLLDKVQLTAISDSLIISVPHSEEACVITLILLLKNIQADLLLHYKTLVRGYVTRGPVVHKDGFIFGLGYSDAYCFEEKKLGGDAPRIIVDDKIVDEASRWIELERKRGDYFTDLFDFIEQDSNDGRWFIDYLKFKPKQAGLLNIKEISSLSAVDDFIEESLKNFAANNEILPKYCWLRKYFDRRIEIDKDA